MKTSKETLEPLLPPKQTAAWLGVSDKSIYRLVKARKLNAIRVGRALRFDPSDVRKYIDANRA